MRGLGRAVREVTERDRDLAGEQRRPIVAMVDVLWSRTWFALGRSTIRLTC
jgi:hypothetical protein